MFGYVIANKTALTAQQLERYKACYCGLCRALKEKHGQLSRLALNFDMTFLVLMLSSMYEPKEYFGHGKCALHPVHGRDFWRSRFSDYAADMTVALAYHNCIDDWNDDKKPFSLAYSKILEKSYSDVKQRHSERCEVIESCLAELKELEAASAGADDVANCFGRLMGELFAVEDDSWTKCFRAFGEALGRFIYMMDACADLESDVRSGSYNPFIAMGRESISEEEKREILKMLIAECTMEFEKLPLVQDIDILRNILYSGVWSQYEQAIRKKKGEKQEND